MLPSFRLVGLAMGLILIAGCNPRAKSIPFLNNGQKWDRSIPVLGNWDNDSETPDTYLHWAPVNVGFDPSGEIASSEDHRVGRLYQWGADDEETNKVAKMRYYNEAAPKFWYLGVDMEMNYTGDRWNNGNGPCPKGWRLPTSYEFEILISGKNGGYGWTEDGRYGGSNSYKGAEFFGMNEDTTPGSGVFFPASGRINGSYPSARDFAEVGAYWTSEAESVNKGPMGNYARAVAKALIYNKEDISIESVRHASGCSVRCVHDVIK